MNKEENPSKKKKEDESTHVSFELNQMPTIRSHELKENRNKEIKFIFTECDSLDKFKTSKLSVPRTVIDGRFEYFSMCIENGQDEFVINEFTRHEFTSILGFMNNIDAGSSIPYLLEKKSFAKMIIFREAVHFYSIRCLLEYTEFEYLKKLKQYNDSK